LEQEPYHDAERLFYVVDNGSSHRGQTSVERMRRRDKKIILVHTPVHASWLNQVEIYFSIIQRKVLTPNDFANVDAIRLRLALYEQLSNRTPKPFAWKFTRQDLLNWLKRAAPHFLAASAVKRRRPGLLRRYLRNGPLSENAQKARRDICGEDGKQWADKLLHTFKHDGYEPTWQQLLEWHVGLRRGQRRIGS